MAQAPSRDVTLHFVTEQLEWYGVSVEAAIRKAIAHHDIGITDELVNTLRSEVVRQAATDGAFNLIFNDRGRFVDMGAGRGQPRSMGRMAETPEQTREKRTGRKPKPFYSKPVYGLLDRLIYRLANNLTLDTVARIKAQLESPD